MSQGLSWWAEVVCFLLLQKSLFTNKRRPRFSFLSFGSYVCFQECIYLSIYIKYNYLYIYHISLYISYHVILCDHIKLYQIVSISWQFMWFISPNSLQQLVPSDGGSTWHWCVARIEHHCKASSPSQEKNAERNWDGNWDRNWMELL